MADREISVTSQMSCFVANFSLDRHSLGTSKSVQKQSDSYGRKNERQNRSHIMPYEIAKKKNQIDCNLVAAKRDQNSNPGPARAHMG